MPVMCKMKNQNIQKRPIKRPIGYRNCKNVGGVTFETLVAYPQANRAFVKISEIVIIII